MAIRFTCSCGVLLEVDDNLTGQNIHCPDCQRAVQVPSLDRVPQRTSGLAIASLVLALIGAFTVVGTIVAVVLGVLALLTISRQRDRLAGEAFAITGILLGVVLTGMSLFAYTSVELFGINSVLRESQWFGKLEYDEPLERPIGADYALTRPSKEWGVYEPEFQFGDFNEGLILANLRKDAFVTCIWVSLIRPENLELAQADAVDKLRNSQLFRLLSRNVFPAEPVVVSKKAMPTRDGLDIRELKLRVKLGRRNREFLVHLARTRDDSKIYVIAGGVRAEQFKQYEPELRQILGTFKIHR